MHEQQVKVLPGGWVFEAGQDSVLRAAERAGVVLPSSCRNGTCRTCICRMLAGEVRYLVEWPGLSAEEKREGWILPCVAVAQAPLVLEAPLAVRLP